MGLCNLFAQDVGADNRIFCKFINPTHNFKPPYLTTECLHVKNCFGLATPFSDTAVLQLYYFHLPKSACATVCEFIARLMALLSKYSWGVKLDIHHQGTAEGESCCSADLLEREPSLFGLPVPLAVAAKISGTLWSPLLCVNVLSVQGFGWWICVAADATMPLLQLNLSHYSP